MEFATDRKEVKDSGATIPNTPSASNSQNGGADVAIRGALGVNVGVSESLATITEGTTLRAYGGKVAVVTSNDTDAHIRFNVRHIEIDHSLAVCVVICMPG